MRNCLIISRGGGISDLSINVITEQIESKGLVTDTYLPSGSAIGVTVLNTSGGNYDGTAYSNIKFTSSGTGTSQTWAGASTVKLSATEGYCYAYYPYSGTASSITSIPVSAGGTDYMYASRVGVNDKVKTATLSMKHALSAIRFSLKRGTYAGTGKVTAVSVSSAALGSTGTLNATTGAVTAANKGTAVSQSANLTLNSNVQNVDVVMVPSGTAGLITLSVTIDGKAYSTTVSSTTIAQGNCYTYTLTVNAGALALSGVKVGAWGYNSAGAPTITAAGYTVTFAGNYEDIAFKNTVSGNTVTILACSLGEEKPAKVFISGTATLSQPVDLSTNRRTITLANISSNVTITFNGLGSIWDTVTADGVYYVDEEGEYTDIPSSTCKAVVLINNAKNQRLMIEKYEHANNEESTTVYKTAAKKKGSKTATSTFSWGGYGTNWSGISNYTQVGAGSTNGSGYLYLDGSGLNTNPSTWTSGALSDFKGQSYSETIKTITSNGTEDLNYAPMSYLMNAFNTLSCPKSVNQGYLSWYVPSCGQLGLIWINKTAIDNALTAIGGTAFLTTEYWSSSEKSSESSWYVNMKTGYVMTDYKCNSRRVRLVRDL